MTFRGFSIHFRVCPSFQGHYSTFFTLCGESDGTSYPSGKPVIFLFFSAPDWIFAHFFVADSVANAITRVVFAIFSACFLPKLLFFLFFHHLFCLFSPFSEIFSDEYTLSSFSKTKEDHRSLFFRNGLLLFSLTVRSSSESLSQHRSYLSRSQAARRGCHPFPHGNE